MNDQTKRHSLDRWLTAVVVGHLIITFFHGAAHGGAHVALDQLSALFVLLVIEIAPLAGLALSVRQPRAGAALIAASMAAALIFGVVNHFLIISPDHVNEVATAWRPLFAGTAWLLVLSEAAGVVVAMRRVARPVEVLS